MSYEIKKYSGILKEIFGEEERYLPQGYPRKITFTRIRIQLNNGENFDTMTLSPISKDYKNKPITLEEKSKVKKDGTCIFKEKVSSEKLNLVALVRFKENRASF